MVLQLTVMKTYQMVGMERMGEGDGTMHDHAATSNAKQDLPIPGLIEGMIVLRARENNSTNRRELIGLTDVIFLMLLVCATLGAWCIPAVAGEEQAEAMAALEAANLARRMEITNVSLQGDNLNVVNALKGKIGSFKWTNK
ncbi:hypothetical protein C5167_027025 [Papaver somniferum]|nr:hypothetical protein C5167_027025 [Papaver somniferum]